MRGRTPSNSPESGLGPSEGWAVSEKGPFRLQEGDKREAVSGNGTFRSPMSAWAVLLAHSVQERGFWGTK